MGNRSSGIVDRSIYLIFEDLNALCCNILEYRCGKTNISQFLSYVSGKVTDNCMNLSTKCGGLILKMPYYAVRSGRNPGVYLTWGEAQKNVEGFQGAVHKKFNTKIEADAFLATRGGYAPSRIAQAIIPAPRHITQAIIPISTKPIDITDSYEERNFYQSIPVLASQSYGSSSSLITSKRSTLSAIDNSSSDSKHDYVMYTDGACKGNQNVHQKSCPAGWGAVVLSGSHDVIAEIHAPVELLADSPYYLGADVKSNNTAELSAIGESLIYLRDSAKDLLCSCSSTVCRCPKASVVVRYDSEYAAKSVMGQFNGAKNVKLYTTIREVYRSVQEGGKYTAGEFQGLQRRPVIILFEKVKGHSGDNWNDRADHLANEGAKGLTCRADTYHKEPDPIPSTSGKILDLTNDSDEPHGVCGKLLLNCSDFSDQNKRQRK